MWFVQRDDLVENLAAAASHPAFRGPVLPSVGKDYLARRRLNIWRRSLLSTRPGRPIPHTKRSTCERNICKYPPIPWESRPALEQAGERILRFYRDRGGLDKAVEWQERLRTTTIVSQN
jgi:hypothetical protein